MRKNFIIGMSYGNGLVGLTEFHILCLFCGFFKDMQKAIKKVAEFKNWMNGQTCGINQSGENVYYVDDISRFLDGLPIID